VRYHRQQFPLLDGLPASPPFWIFSFATQQDINIMLGVGMAQNDIWTQILF
jgi:hypothetical protein